MGNYIYNFFACLGAGMTPIIVFGVVFWRPIFKHALISWAQKEARQKGLRKK